MNYGLIVHRGEFGVCVAICRDVEDALYMAEYLFHDWEYDSVDVVVISKGTIYATYER